MANFKLDQIQSTASGMDAFFESEPAIVTPMGQKTAATAKAPRIRVASLGQLNEFTRVASDQLIHKSTNDLWSIRKEGEEFYIERQFDNSSPVKG